MGPLLSGRSAAILLLAGAWLLGSLAAGGGSAFPADEDIKEEERINALKSLQRRIEEEQRALGRVDRRRESAVELLRTMEQRLAEEEHAMHQAEAGVLKAERALARLESRQGRLGSELQALEGRLAARFVALYKLKEVGYFRILFSSRDYQDLARRTRFLGRIVAADSELIAAYQARYGKAQAEARALAEEHRRLARLKEEAAATRNAFEARRKEKLDLLDRLGKEKEARLASLTELEEAARALEGTFEALRAMEPPPGAPADQAWRGGFPDTGERFSALRGRIQNPVEGRIIKRFGLQADPVLGTQIRSNGITFRASYGEPVHAVSGGRVLYAGWFRGYGRILITDHGNDYYTLVAHASELLKQVGDTVAKGEVVARVGDSGSLEGPKLYFEIRERGKPVDPMQWMSH